MADENMGPRPERGERPERPERGERGPGRGGRFQRRLTIAIKRARLLALLPYTAEHIRKSNL